MTDALPTPEARSTRKRRGWWRPGASGWAGIVVLACLTTWVTAWGGIILSRAATSFYEGLSRKLAPDGPQSIRGTIPYGDSEAHWVLTSSADWSLFSMSMEWPDRVLDSSRPAINDERIPKWARPMRQKSDDPAMQATRMSTLVGTIACGWPFRCARYIEFYDGYADGVTVDPRPSRIGRLRLRAFGHTFDFPADIYWPGLVFDIVFWSVLWLITCVGCKGLRQAIRGRHACRACGYVLSGLRDDPGGRICPECGERERTPVPAVQA